MPVTHNPQLKTHNRFHFIAIGGAAMHNLALALKAEGNIITGSDDEIMEPSLSRLKNAGLLPEKTGWFPEKITKDLDAIILGMHARADNPELLRAQQLGIRIYSYPEYLYEFSKNKKRVVIGGSHGKTTITSMILHVLKQAPPPPEGGSTDRSSPVERALAIPPSGGGGAFDYMVGAKLEGFDTMVKLSDAPVIIIEGDEYLASPVDRRPKFHLYHADIALLSGIAWDHINVFPTYAEYVKQFQIYVDQIPPSGVLVYCSDDAEVEKVVENTSSYCKRISYSVPKHINKNGITYLIDGNGKEILLNVFGEHNLRNIEGARKVCGLLGIGDQDFYWAISSFKGAARRLEMLGANESLIVYKDFAHSPSKLKATIEAVKSQFPEKNIIGCMELHTFSSLNENFLLEYKDTMDKADEAIVYFNPHTIEHKKLKSVTVEHVKKAFGRDDVNVFTDSSALKNYLFEKHYSNAILLMMSSGTFDGINLEEFAQELLSTNNELKKTN